MNNIFSLTKKHRAVVRLVAAIACSLFTATMVGCGGGAQGGQKSGTGTTSSQELWIRASAENSTLTTEEMERQLSDLGLLVEDVEVVNGQTRFLIALPADQTSTYTAAIGQISWAKAETSETATNSAATVASTRIAFATTAPVVTSTEQTNRTKAKLWYRVFPNPTEGNNLCYAARTIPPVFTSHQEAYQDCLNRVAATSADQTLGPLVPINGNYVNSAPEKMEAAAKFRFSGSPWYDLGFNVTIGFSNAECPSEATLTSEVLKNSNGSTNTTYWCETPEVEKDPETPPEINDDEAEQAGMCTSNPIIPASGEKFFSVIDIEDRAPHSLTFERTYRTQWQLEPQAQMGTTWGHNHAGNLRLDSSDSSGNTLILQLSDGAQRKFTRTATAAPWVNTTHRDQLVTDTTSGGAPAWRYVRQSDNSQWVFTQPTASAVGKLQSQTQRDGWTYKYTYNTAGQLESIANQFNRKNTLTYTATGLLATVTGPDSRIVRYTWDALSRLTREGLHNTRHSVS